jgi:hypothetical protein
VGGAVSKRVGSREGREVRWSGDQRQDDSGDKPKQQRNKVTWAEIINFIATYMKISYYIIVIDMLSMLSITAEIIYVSHEKLHLFVSFDRLQATSPPGNPNCLFYLFERVSAYLRFICRLGIVTRGHPATQPEFKHPTAGN